MKNLLQVPHFMYHNEKEFPKRNNFFFVCKSQKEFLQTLWDLSVIVRGLLVMLFPRGSPLNELDACYVSVVKVEVKPCQ